MSPLDPLLDTARLVVCVGPGGVGKTSIAAALALEAAARGRRVALLTIDPARRLADALGLDGLDDRLRPVPESAERVQAAMLDTKTSFDALVARIAPEPDARARILDNRVYRSFSRTLARSHAYVAMERLHEVLTSAEHDLVVLDTPPTRSALDILDAPGRLARFLDERVLGAFLPTRGRPTGWLRSARDGLAGRLLGALSGERMVSELAGFFEVFLHLRHGFAARAADVQAALRDPRTAFVLVTAPDTTHLADAAYLRDGLLARGVPLAALLVNRAFALDGDGHPLGPGAAYDPDAALDEAWPELGRDRDAALALLAAVRALRAELVARARRAHADTLAFCAALDPSVVRLRFPTLDDAPTSSNALRGLIAAGAPV